MRFLPFVLCCSLAFIHPSGSVSLPALTTTSAPDDVGPVLACPLPSLLSHSLSAFAPPEISAADFPIQKVYHIRTRIVIETVAMETTDNDLPFINIFATDSRSICGDIKNVETVYKEIGLKLDVIEYTYQEYDTNFAKHRVDAALHPHCLSIYYLLPCKNGNNGMSSVPWDVIPYGIYLSSTRNQWTLAHEVGHYFGLLHTFDEDFCADTPPQPKQWCVGDADTQPNCRNVMNYCKHYPKKITHDQIVRMRKFLRGSRQEQVILKPIGRKRIEIEELFGNADDIIRSMYNDSTPETKK